MAEEALPLTLLPALLLGDVEEVKEKEEEEEDGTLLRSGGGGDGRSCISIASFCSAALRSAMSASKSLSSSSWRDSGVRGQSVCQVQYQC